MIDPLSAPRLPSLTPPVAPRPAAPAAPAEGAADGDFASQLRRQLEQVNRMQNEADQSVQNLLTGQSDNLAHVFTATRKAEVAFNLLMEIRNKLVDAYNELRQLRV